MGKENNRAELLIALAPYLTGRLLGEALAIAKSIQDEESRSKALSALAQTTHGPTYRGARLGKFDT